MKAVQNTLDLPVFGVFFPQAILRFRFVRVSPSSPTIVTRTFNATPQAAQKQYKSSEAIRFVPKLRRTRLVFMILDFRRKKKEKTKQNGINGGHVLLRPSAFNSIFGLRTILCTRIGKINRQN